MNSKIKILVDDKEIDYYTFVDELRNGDYFFKENGEWYLHKRPTIIEEDKKIERINVWYNYNGIDDKELTKIMLDELKDKINEIIDYLNKEKDNEKN